MTYRNCTYIHKWIFILCFMQTTLILAAGGGKGYKNPRRWDGYREPIPTMLTSVNDGNTFLTTTVFRDMKDRPTTADPGLLEWKWRGDQFNTSDSEKIKRYANEFVIDAYWRCRQTDDMRDDYDEYPSFQIGYVIGVIREKFRRIMAFYRNIISRHTRRTKYLGPTFYKLVPFYYFYIYDHIHTLGMDIERMIMLLEEIPEYMLVDVWTEGYKERLRARKEAVAKTSTTEKTKTLRSNATDLSVEIDLAKIKSFKDQEDHKSKLRQQYLMKKINRPINASTRKIRFIEQWPVEDTWDDVIEKANMGYY